MSLGQAPVQGQVFNSSAKFCREHRDEHGPNPRYELEPEHGEGIVSEKNVPVVQQQNPTVDSTAHR